MRAAALAALQALLALTAPLAQAQTPPAYNTVELQAEASREVANDSLNAVLYAEASDANPARLADMLNRAANEALKLAQAEPAVRARSGGFTSFPVYDRNQKLTGWRGRTELRLESRDFQAASALIAKLQEKLQLSSVSFSISQETRKSTENDLIAEAIKAFRGRADIARAALGGASYKLRRIALNTGMAGPPPRPLMRMAAEAAPVAAPVFEGGVSTVTVTAAGAIEVE